MEALIIGLGALGLYILVLVLATLLRGFVLVKLWGWFVAPVFGLTALHIVPAIGLAMVVGYLVQGPQDYAKEPDAAKRKTVAWTQIATPFITLLFGYLIHLFM